MTKLSVLRGYCWKQSRAFLSQSLLSFIRLRSLGSFYLGIIFLSAWQLFVPPVVASLSISIGDDGDGSAGEF